MTWNARKKNTVIRLALGIAIVTGLLVISSCVSPGDADQDMFARYQRVMETRSPQDRLGDDGLDFLAPSPTPTIPSLKVIEGADGERGQVLLSLEESIIRTLANNTDIRVAGFTPSVSWQEITQAAAAFDYVLLGQFDYSVEDLQSFSAFGEGQSHTRAGQVGFTQRAVTGAQWRALWNLSHNFDPTGIGGKNRIVENIVSFEVTQPLLRDGWPEVTLAELKVARLTHDISQSQFRVQVEQVVTQVVASYWQLIQARRDQLIAQSLLDRTIETRDRIKKRRAVDASDVEYQQAQSRVATRAAILIRAKNGVRSVENALARLLADPQLNVLNDREIVPTTRPSTDGVQLDAEDQLLTALNNSPDLEQVRLAIDIAAINVSVAKNRALPRLDLTVATSMQGLGNSASGARQKMETGDYVSTSMSLSGEYPIGNRARKAEVAKQRLQQAQAIAELQNRADAISLDVRDRIRQADTALAELEAQSRAVEASQKQLEALEVEEELRRMTPEFLQVKLSAQGELAAAQSAENLAITSYNVALIDLARVTGTILKVYGVEIALPQVVKGR